MTTLQPSKQGVRADKLVALPSLSCGLSSLPQAKSMDSLKNVLSKTAASHPQAPPPVPAYMNPPHHNANSPNSSPPLMMRKSKPKFSA
ncbi:hypothetical protein BD769DRAFT_1484638 [Suillus cothurnatus]|nr:hypothetical protein BD769DRAFT_1484638 [Suillus cothurnatus]